jgi:hypothetical protein
VSSKAPTAKRELGATGLCALRGFGLRAGDSRGARGARVGSGILAATRSIRIGCEQKNPPLQARPSIAARERTEPQIIAKMRVMTR